MTTIESSSSMSDFKIGKGNGSEKKFTGKHFLISILCFFGVIFGMNFVFIYYATNTWTGLSKENAYVDGLNYNQTLEAAQTQLKLGWRSTLDLAVNGGQHKLSFSLKTEDAQSLGSFIVTAVIGRPTLKSYDQTIVLAESKLGLYQANIDLPLKGQWHVSLKAVSPDGTPFQLEKRFFIK